MVRHRAMVKQCLHTTLKLAASAHTLLTKRGFHPPPQHFHPPTVTALSPPCDDTYITATGREWRPPGGTDNLPDTLQPPFVALVDIS